jgi:hypothetical protein
MHSRIIPARPARLTCRACLPVGVLALAVAFGGCKPNTVETAEVSGTVKLDGKPLPGGSVSFVADKGGIAAGGVIGEDGTYKVTGAPVGPVHIIVDNRQLESKPRQPKGPMLKKPDSQAPTPMKGHYVRIPDKYHSADKTPLTYTVKSGPQTYEIVVQSK